MKKRFVIIVCLFTFLFLPFAQKVNYKDDNAQAFALIDDAAFLLLVCALAGTGIAVASDENARLIISDWYYENYGVDSSWGDTAAKDLFEEYNGKLRFKDLKGFTEDILPSLSKYNGILTNTDVTLHNVEVGQDITTAEMGKDCTKTVTYNSPKDISFYCKYASGKVETTPVFKRVTRWWMETVYNPVNGGEYQVRLYFESDGQIGFLFGCPTYYNAHYGIASISDGSVSVLTDKKVKDYDFTGATKDLIGSTSDWLFKEGTNLSIDKDFTIGNDTVIDWGNISVNNGVVTGVPSVSTDIPNEIDKPIEGNPPVDLPFDDTFPDTSVGDTTGEYTGILGKILGALKSIWAVLKNILDFLLNLITDLLSAIKDLLLSLFVPNDTYFSDTIDGLKSQLQSKLPYEQYYSLFEQEYTGSKLEDIYINIYGRDIVVVRVTLLEKFRDFFNTVCYAFMFFGLAYYNYRQVYKLIRGSSYTDNIGTISNASNGYKGGRK